MNVEILYIELFSFKDISISIISLLKIFLPIIGGYVLGKYSVNVLRKKAAKLWKLLGNSRFILEILLRVLLILTGLSLGLRMAGIESSVLYYFYSLIFKPFIHIGDSPVSLISLALLLIIFSVSIFLSKYSINILRADVYPKTNLDDGIKNIIDTVLKYFIIVTGVILGLQINGINLSIFATIGAGLMVGIGFGLQNIASNFVSGVVILLERPIKVGDYIEINGVCGVIERITGRSTIIKSRQNISMIVPNSKFISENVINWSHNDPNVVLRIPIGISYSSDPGKAKRILLEIADENKLILEGFNNQVLLNSFGASSIDMILEVWTNQVDNMFEIISEINFEIHKRFAEEGISIPFPQLDIHHKDDSILTVKKDHSISI